MPQGNACYRQALVGTRIVTLHRLPAMPQTVRFGMFDAAFAPVLTVNSGDTVVMETVSGGPEVMPDDTTRFAIPDALLRIHAADLGGGRLLRYPRAETPTHYIPMGMHEDLDRAMEHALREMIAFIVTRGALTPEQAYQFCSLAVDFRITQTVNGEKGVHGMLAKGLLF